MIEREDGLETAGSPIEEGRQRSGEPEGSAEDHEMSAEPALAEAEAPSEEAVAAEAEQIRGEPVAPEVEASMEEPEIAEEQELADAEAPSDEPGAAEVEEPRGEAAEAEKPLAEPAMAEVEAAMEAPTPTEAQGPMEEAAEFEAEEPAEADSEAPMEESALAGSEQLAAEDAVAEPLAAPEEPAEAGVLEQPAEAEVLEQGAEALPQVEEPDDGRLWYVVHCYSGYENKVRHNLEQRIETMNMKDKIFDVVVPTEEEMEVKDGKRRTVERRVFPGYILVQMLMDEDSWYVVRNTPGVTGFVGMGNEPTPLRPEEVAQIVKRMEAEAPRIKVTYKAGQKVRIIDGPFNDFIGTVDNIDMDKAKVRVMVSFFGRETPVELDFLQVEKA